MMIVRGNYVLDIYLFGHFIYVIYVVFIIPCKVDVIDT